MKVSATLMSWSTNKGKIGAFLLLVTLFICLYLQQPFFITYTRPEKIESIHEPYEDDQIEDSKLKNEEQIASRNSNVKRNELKENDTDKWLFMETLKSMSTRELALKILENCKLSSHFNATSKDATNVFNSVEKLVSKARQNKQYRWPPVYNAKDKKFYSYCFNTKSGSTFLKSNVFRRGLRGAKNVKDENLVNAVMVIREPMHRMLSAYLDKLAECEGGQKNICGQWKTFALNIQLFVSKSNRTESNLFSSNSSASSKASLARQQRKGVDPKQISFSDFVDYIIHMYLRNDGKIRSPFTDVATPDWTWWHWESVVMDKCFPCGAVWRDVVLFENMETHLKQIVPKYPVLFLNPNKLPTIVSSDTNEKVKRYFAQLSDKQLWFLGNVMYSLDYAVLPYDFNSFLESIGRHNLTNN